MLRLERDLDAKVGSARITRGSGFATTWATDDLAKVLDLFVGQSLDILERCQALLVHDELSGDGGETHTGIGRADGGGHS
jgi:hypothetical protein